MSSIGIYKTEHLSAQPTYCRPSGVERLPSRVQFLHYQAFSFIVSNKNLAASTLVPHGESSILMLVNTIDSGRRLLYQQHRPDLSVSHHGRLSSVKPSEDIAPVPLDHQE